MNYFLAVLKRKKYYIFWLLLAVTLILYAQGLMCNFILDDNALIVNNPHVKNLKFLPRVWTEDIYPFSSFKSSTYYRPLLMTTYALDYSLWHLKPFGFRITNILIHVINSYLVFILLLTLSQHFRLSLITSFLFCIHPVHISAINFISGRADLLVTLFLLASSLKLIGYLKTKDISQYAASIFFFILALLSRENALLAPLCACLILIQTKKINRDALLAISGFWIIALIYVALRSSIATNALLPALSLTPAKALYLKIFDIVHVLKEYAIIFIFPWPLYLMRSTPALTTLNFSDIIFVSLLIALAFFAIKNLKKEKNMFSFGFLWTTIFFFPLPFLITCFPDLGLTMAEHWLYLPSIGLCAILGYFLRSLFKKEKIVFCMLLFFYASLSIVHNKTWRNDISIFTNTLKYAPNNERISLNLANVYLEKGLLEKALVLYKKILVQNPASWRAYNQIGNIYQKKNELDEALSAYKLSTQLHPDNEIPYCNVGFTYETQNKYKEAFDAYMDALAIDPNSSLALTHLGSLYLKQRFYQESIDIYKKSLRVNPSNSQTYTLMAMAYFNIKQNTDAHACLTRALHLEPRSITNLKDIAAVYGNHEEFDKAIYIWTMALRLDPKNEEIKNNILRANKLKKEIRVSPATTDLPSK